MSTEAVRNWHNWSSSVKSKPKAVVKPASLAELSQLVSEYARKGRQVRVVGAGHSFTPLVHTDDIFMTLDN
jgi:FAD/FMN-containing dehydrogenase